MQFGRLICDICVAFLLEIVFSIRLRVKGGVMRTYYNFKIRRRGYHCFLIRHKARSCTTEWTIFKYLRGFSVNRAANISSF